MIGRTRAALAALTVVALAACGDSPSNDTAAEVGDTAVSRDQYEDLLAALAANPQDFPGYEKDLDTGTVDGEAGRNVLRVLILNAASEAFVAESGESITDADRQAARELVEAQSTGLPEAVVDVAVEQQAAATAIGRVAASSGEPQARYEASPADLGVLCVRHILVATEEEADAVLQELADGADFAALAAERSTEPAAAETGGALEAQPGQPCIPLDQAQAGLDATFLQAATVAVPGTPVGPVQTQFGWHVILARPYDEVAETVDGAVGTQLFQEHLTTTEVEVDPRYGRWDSAQGAVVPL